MEVVGRDTVGVPEKGIGFPSGVVHGWLLIGLVQLQLKVS